MPVMKDSLQQEVKMLRACVAKAKGASGGFWFTEGALHLGALAKA